MAMRFNPTTALDCYKFDHRRQSPEDTTGILANFTARGSRLPDVKSVLFFGFRGFLKELQEMWNQEFFEKPKSYVTENFTRRVNGMLGPNDIGVEHLEALHDLGYLPLVFKALPEGTEVPLRVPMLTVENTHPDFFWLVNYIETYMSAEIWHPITTATLALRMRRMLDKWASVTSDTPEFVDFQAHDFSFRGMSSLASAAKSGAGHLLSFAGTDTVPALDWIERFYEPSEDAILGVSVAATEHAVMCAGGKMSETETYERLLKLYPSGIVSVVSDTWDLWKVITETLPTLKDRIMGRNGKLVIRPDSGDPVDILTGTQVPRSVGPQHDYPAHDRLPHERNTPEEKGVIELLWDIFGGTVNSKGYRVLDDHIGAIYGDSITFERANEICRRLEAKGFASTNVVLGVGSFTYQYVTRDTFGMAMKTTWAEVGGEGRDLFKDPVTDNGLKKSATGRLAVFETKRDGIFAVERADQDDEDSPSNLLKTVWKDGHFTEQGLESWDTIVERVGKRALR